MSKKLKKTLKLTFNAPKPTKKIEFFNSLRYPKSTNLEFFLSQLGYIRKRFWCLSVLVLMGMVIFAFTSTQGKEIVGLLSGVLPLLTLTGITEINKSVSFNMTELEMSCKYNLGKITLIRLSAIGAFHFIILLLSLLIFKDQTQYGIYRYALYAVTPFMLSSYLSFWLTNHIKSKDALYICSGATGVITIAILITNSSFTEIYGENYILLWSIAFIVIAVLLIKEIYFLLTERSRQWSFA